METSHGEFVPRMLHEITDSHFRRIGGSFHDTERTSKLSNSMLVKMVKDTFYQLREEEEQLCGENRQRKQRGQSFHGQSKGIDGYDLPKEELDLLVRAVERTRESADKTSKKYFSSAAIWRDCLRVLGIAGASFSERARGLRAEDSGKRSKAKPSVGVAGDADTYTMERRKPYFVLKVCL